MPQLAGVCFVGDGVQDGSLHGRWRLHLGRLLCVVRNVYAPEGQRQLLRRQPVQDWALRFGDLLQHRLWWRCRAGVYRRPEDDSLHLRRRRLQRWGDDNLYQWLQRE
jgi:hypothetical protein